MEMTAFFSPPSYTLLNNILYRGNNTFSSNAEYTIIKKNNGIEPYYEIYLGNNLFNQNLLYTIRANKVYIKNSIYLGDVIFSYKENKIYRGNSTFSNDVLLTISSDTPINLPLIICIIGPY